MKFRIIPPAATVGFFLTLTVAGVENGWGETTMLASADQATTISFQSQPGDKISTDSLDLQLVRELIVRYTNAERKAGGLAPVSPEAALQRIAEEHSRDMAEQGYLSHNSRTPDGEVPFQERVSLQELGLTSSGENISLQPLVTGQQFSTRTSASGKTVRDVTTEVSTYHGLAQSTVQGWMKSPAHRDNILTPEFKWVGIGLGIGQRDGLPYMWITQNFGQR